jgi:hypothetical protein
MKFHQCFGMAVLLLIFAGCGPGKPGPSGEIYEGKHVSEWGDVVKSPDQNREARLHAAKVLAKLGKEGVSGKEAIQSLHTAAATDEDPAVRGWAAVALVYAARGTPFPVGQVTGKPLKEAAESSDEELRAAASQMLTRMQSAAAGPSGPPGGKQGGRKGPPAEKTTPPNEDKGVQPPKEDKDASPRKEGKGAPPPDKDKG